MPSTFIGSQKMADIIHRLQYSGSVCISGLTAAGKTTHSHLLAGEFGLAYVSRSQIQLNFMGVSPIQSRDFWITAEAKEFWNDSEFKRIDAELLRLEALSEGYIFDTSTMPWRHKGPALCIWLESTVESRVLKSIVSHHGKGRFSPESYLNNIIEKDRATISLYEKLYAIETGTDLSCFDIILNISSLLDEPTLQASMKSIAITHALTLPAVGLYLTGADEFRHELKETAKRYPEIVKRNNLLEM